MTILLFEDDIRNILAKHFQSIIGKKSKIDMPKDHHLNWTDFE